MALGDITGVWRRDHGIAQLLFSLGQLRPGGIQTRLGGIAGGSGPVQLRFGHQPFVIYVLYPMIFIVRFFIAGPRFLQAGFGLLDPRLLLRIPNAHNDRILGHKIIHIVIDFSDQPGGLRRNGGAVHRLKHAVEHPLLSDGLIRRGDRFDRRGMKRRHGAIDNRQHQCEPRGVSGHIGLLCSVSHG